MTILVCLLASLVAFTTIGAPAPEPPFRAESITLGEHPEFVTTADVNHDGKLDILVANQDSGNISVLLGDGSGHFTPAPGSPFAAGHYPNDIAVGDFNGDGNPDLLIPNHQTPYLTLLLGDGKGRFTSSPHSPFATLSRPHPHGVAIGDFNGDGNLDAVTDSWGNNQIILLPGNGKGDLLTPGRTFDVGKRPYERLRSADINKDGKPDLITTNLDGNNVTVLLGDSRGGFSQAPGSPFPAGAAPWSVAIADINKDGNLDLVTIPYDRDINAAQVGVTILLGNGKGGFNIMAGSPFALTGCHDPSEVAVGDLSGNGSRDIIVTCAQSGNIAILRRTSGSAYRASTFPVKGQPRGIAVADLDGDGKDDIVVADSSGNTITILFSK